MIKRKKYRITFLLLILLAVFSQLTGFTAIDERMVVVVAASSDIDSLSLGELKDIFRGELRLIDNEYPIQIVEYSPFSDIFYRNLLNRSSYSMGKLWLRLIFTGGKVNTPKSFTSAEKLVRFLQTQVNAIGFIPLSIYDDLESDKIKPVVIDSLNYQHPEYLMDKKKESR